MLRVRKKSKPSQMRLATAGVFSRAKPRKQMTDRQVSRKYGSLRARYCSFLKRRASMPERLK